MRRLTFYRSFYVTFYFPHNSSFSTNRPINSQIRLNIIINWFDIVRVDAQNEKGSGEHNDLQLSRKDSREFRDCCSPEQMFYVTTCYEVATLNEPVNVMHGTGAYSKNVASKPPGVIIHIKVVALLVCPIGYFE